jgi:hypothetical protein
VIVAVKEGAVWPLLFIVRQGTGLLFKDEIKNNFTIYFMVQIMTLYTKVFQVFFLNKLIRI